MNTLMQMASVIFWSTFYGVTAHRLYTKPPHNNSVVKHIYIYIYIHAYIHIHTYTSLNILLFIYIHTYIHTYSTIYLFSIKVFRSFHDDEVAGQVDPPCEGACAYEHLNLLVQKELLHYRPVWCMYVCMHACMNECMYMHSCVTYRGCSVRRGVYQCRR